MRKWQFWTMIVAIVLVASSLMSAQSPDVIQHFNLARTLLGFGLFLVVATIAITAIGAILDRMLGRLSGRTGSDELR